MNTCPDFSTPASSHCPFVVPEGYFSQLTSRVMQRISQAERPVEHTMRIVRWIPLLGAASVAALFVLFTNLQVARQNGGGLASSSAASSVSTQHSQQYAEADYAYDYMMADNESAVFDYDSNE